jgi:hypothetical protein
VSFLALERTVYRVAAMDLATATDMRKGGKNAEGRERESEAAAALADDERTVKFWSSIIK